MKRIKKILASLMVVVMVLTAAPLSGFVGLELPNIFDIFASAASYSGTCGDNLTWSLDTSTGELVISGTGEMYDYNDWNYYAPWYSYRSSIKKVTVGDGVTSIGDSAFSGCSSLTSITIPDSVTNIVDFAFYNCTSLTSITIPDGVTSIGDYAFSGCTSLTSITIPDSVTSIGSSAFCNCTSLTSITVDNNNTSYSSDENGVLFNKDKTELIQYPIGNEQTNHTIPDSVTSIGYSAFEDCTSLTSITIPDSLTSIGSAAFRECTSLTDVYYKGTQEQWNAITVGSGNDSLTSATVYVVQTGTCGDNLTWTLDPTTGELVISGTGAMYNCSSSSYVPWYSYRSSIKKVTVGDSVTSIGKYAFYNCTSLASITIPDSVTIISERAFYGCTSLTSITIPDSVTSIGSYAFSGCTSLTRIIIPDSVTSIGSYAFYNCTSLTSITIPDSVTSIGSDAFYNTGYYNNSSNWEDNVLYIGNYLINVKSSLSGTYTIKGGTKCIADKAFYNCTSLTSITIPNSVTSIGSYAFEGCTSLTSITIPDSVTDIGAYAFRNCSSVEKTYYTGTKDEWNLIKLGSSHGLRLYTFIYECNSERPYNNSGQCGKDMYWILYIDGELVISGTGDMYNYDWDPEFCAPWNTSIIQKITIGNGVTSIGNYAFLGCTGLTNVTIPDSVTSIGDSAFWDCTSLTSITIPDSVTSIGEEAFYNCIGIKELTMPVSAKIYNSSGSFNGCTNIEKITLTKGNGTVQSYSNSTGSSNTYYGNTPWYISKCLEIVIEDGVTGIGSYAFYDCDSLTSITISDSVTSIGSYAFYNCKSLESITIPDSVTSISNWVFYGCTSLISIIIPDSVTSIGSSAFENCTSLTNTTIPDSVTSIGNSAFCGCTNFTNITIPDSVKSIGKNTFSNCENLEEVIFTSDGVVAIGEQIFYGSLKAMICCEENSYLHTYAESNNIKFCLLDENGVPSFVVQNDVLLSYRGESTDVFVSAGTKIGYGAFENNSVIETVVLSSSVSRIHANAFKNCASLTTVIIPESVTSIGAGAFDGCDNITIWCYAGSYADSYAAANGIDVEYIALDIEKDILILTLSGTSSLTASLNTPFVENAGVVWSSTNTSIATVDQNGVVKGVKAGTAVIVATSKEGRLRDYCVVKVVGIEAISTATIDHENGVIMGLSSNLDSLDGYIELSDPDCSLNYDSLGTDSIVYVECDGEIVDAYSVIIFGDVNGDSWYDGQDAIIVDCLANGMLTKDDVSEAVYMAADCNHDGVIDQLDVALLNEAGTLLANVDQSKPAEVLLETSAEYVEYLDLIDQSPELDVEDETDTPEVDVEDTPEADTEDAKVDIFEMILNFIKSIFEMLLSYIPMPLK